MDCAMRFLVTVVVEAAYDSRGVVMVHDGCSVGGRISVGMR